jgi:hypothetical protein
MVGILIFFPGIVLSSVDQPNIDLDKVKIILPPQDNGTPDLNGSFGLEPPPPPTFN